MKKILSEAFFTSINIAVFSIFFTASISNQLSHFITNKRLLNEGVISINLGDMLSVIPSVLFVSASLFLILSKTKIAYILALFAIIISSINLFLGSLATSSFSNDFIIIFATLFFGVLGLVFIVYKKFIKKGE